MQQIRTVWTISEGDNPGIIPVEFGQFQIYPPGRGQIRPKGHNLNNKVHMLYTKYESIFENCISRTYYLTPWTTYATN